MLLVSEPNKLALSGRRDWIYDSQLNAAIYLTGKHTIIMERGSGPGFCYITTPKYTIYSCYSSGNEDIDCLDKILQDIEVKIKNENKMVIVSGDFNSKSPQWGMRNSDSRGLLLTDWMATNNLKVVNKGCEPTFQCGSYGSILDLTITSEEVQIEHWLVSEEETLSDHRYIIFEISEAQEKLQNNMQENGWQIGKLNIQRLEKSIETHLLVDEHPTASAFSKALKCICDESMPRKKKCHRGPAVYWWCDEIAQLRKECNQKRRAYTRERNKSLLISEQKLNNYKDSKKILRNKIKKAKKDCWKNICDSVDCDIFGDGYKILMKKINGFPPKPYLSMEQTEEIVKDLFPLHGMSKQNSERSICDIYVSDVNSCDKNVCDIHNCDADDCDRNIHFEPYTLEELLEACKKLKNGKAPGPGNVPPEVLKHVITRKAEYVLQVYNNLARLTKFPQEWKQAKLVLLSKNGNGNSYRPISLLDVEGKLYEHLILGRLNNELKRTGGLSTKQYGFQKGKQTTDAITKVIQLAKNAAAFSHINRRFCAVITLDVKNAFNSASWEKILRNLKKRNIDKVLWSTIASYLNGRKIILEADGKSKEVDIYGGVPQGSVLGPTLWNVLYDGLLELDMPGGVTLIGFADDIAMVIVGENEEILINLGNAGIARVVRWMKEHDLQLAPHKTEAVLLTTKRKIAPIFFNVLGIDIAPSKAIKYLGVWLDTKLTFGEHISRLVVKAEKTVAALSNLMPKIRGPRASKRRILASVIHSQILYAAPAWHTATKCQNRLVKLRRLQRSLCIRVCSAYRTISGEGVGVIAGIPPIDLLIQERYEVYNGSTKNEARAQLMEKWQEKWTGGKHGRWTFTLIPNLHKWITRPYGEVDYYITQILSGHGYFKKYLYIRKKIDTPDCDYCQAEDDAEHTLFNCCRWQTQREEFYNRTGNKFCVAEVVKCLVGSEKEWQNAVGLMKYIIMTKTSERET